jgi:hypothetical protein
LEDRVRANNYAEDEIDYQNLRYSRARPRAVAASAAEDHMMMVVIVIDDYCKAVQYWSEKTPQFW